LLASLRLCAFALKIFLTAMNEHEMSKMILNNAVEWHPAVAEKRQLTQRRKDAKTQRVGNLILDAFALAPERL